ncbi:MAG: glycosyltransferase [Akkermansiaceae bacterium]|nr:glycosyltransferase [Akkermansiaceae bacterium]
MSSHSPTVRQRVQNPRSIAWGICLAIAAVACVAWSLIPVLEAQPLLRITIFATCGLSMLGLVFFIPKTTDQTATRLIILSAVFLRIILWPAPVSDDVNRYAWEGRLTASGENPYSAPAADPRWQDQRDAQWQAMNHRDSPTAYPPGIQWINAAVASLSSSLKSFKALALLGDLAVLLLLLRLLRENAAPLRWAGFWAFNPIVLISFAAEAHFDSLMVAALLAAILAASREKKSVWLWIALAIQIKLVCLILIPLFLTRKLLRSSWLILPILILPGLPFLSALPEWLDGVRSFAGTGAFNAPLYTSLASVGITASLVKATCTAAFILSAAAICIARWRGLPLIDACLWMLGALLFCSPIVHFWYLAWLLPLAALRPSFSWITLSITMAAYFTAWWTQETHGWWGFGHGIAAIIWLPWLIAVLAQNRFLIAKIRSPRLPEEPFSLSIVLPVLNPGAELTQLISSLRSELAKNEEIILVDGGSESLPEIPGTRVISAPRGRGNQIAAGIAATNSTWILIAHADATPQPGFRKAIVRSAALHPRASMMAAGQRFDKTTPATLIVEALNEIRVVFGGVAFGDQTMILRRAALAASGGFPAQPLMEDVEASMRLSACGEILYLGEEWNVSARKWSRNFIPRFIQVVRLVASYQLARLKSREHAATVSERMYREYYG